MNPANVMTSLRILIVPFLAYAAFARNEVLFLSLFIFGGLTDVLDGFLARRFGQHTSWGSSLDTIADMLFYPVGLLCTIFVPAFAQHWQIILAVLLIMGVSMAICALRGTFHAVHRWPSKIASGALFLFILITVAIGFSILLFSTVAVLVVVAAIDRLISSRKK